MPLAPSNLHNHVRLLLSLPCYSPDLLGHYRLPSCTASCMPPAMPVPPHQYVPVPLPRGQTLLDPLSDGAKLKENLKVKALSGLSKSIPGS